MNHPRDDEKLLIGESSLPETAIRQPQRQCTWRRVCGKMVKAVFALVASLLIVAVCAYAGHKVLYGTAPHWPGREGDMTKYMPGDCRSTGCHNGFSCAPVDAHVACFIGPCPSTLYECIPSAMVGNPDATEAFILPISAENSPVMAQASPEADSDAPYTDDRRVTEAFYACVQQHDGQGAWKHSDGCNSCRCTMRGTVACTKMLCSPGFRAPEVSQAMNQHSDVHTTVMVPLASASGDESAVYISVPIDIKA